MNYPGGKGLQYRNIINQIPPHRVYIEGFLGGGAVMRSKRPAELNIGIESNLAVLRQFTAEIARNSDAPGDTVINSEGCRALSPELAIGSKDQPGHIFICGDAISFLSNAPLRSDCFVYLDPPYLMETRSGKRIYGDHELTDLQHLGLLSVIKSLRCNVALSGYYSEIYSQHLSDWRHISYDAITRGGTTRREYLWMNYPEPIELHQYDWLGDDFREREKLNRQKRRWVQRINAMPILQQRMLRLALLETRQK